MDGSDFRMLVWDSVHGDVPPAEPGFAAGLPLMLAVALVTLTAIIALGPVVPVIPGM